MKLISLNAWGGKKYFELIDFLEKESPTTDIFSFQEVFNTKENPVPTSEYKLDLYEKFSKTLGDFQGYFFSTVDNYIAGSFTPNLTNYNLSWGQAIFVKKNIKVKSSGHFFVFGNKETFDVKDWNSFPRVVTYVVLENKDKTYTICNLHGIWTKEGKNDTSTKLSQSNQIIDFFNKQTGGKILVGDFNLNPETESIYILERKMKNLVKEYNIPTTRNKFYPGEEKFADYTFVSSDIEVKKFEVPNIKVSDHLPMILEFTN